MIKHIIHLLINLIIHIFYLCAGYAFGLILIRTLCMHGIIPFWM